MGETSIVDAYNASDYQFLVEAKNSTVKHMSFAKGDGSRLTDALSSVECDDLVITVKNKKQQAWANEYTTTPVTKKLGTITVYKDTSSQTAVTLNLKVSRETLSKISIFEAETIECSNTALSSPIRKDGYFMIRSPDGVVSFDETDQQYIDNLVGKQLTDANGVTPSGLNVAVSIAGGESGYVISGTPKIKRADYYLIVKSKKSDGTAWAANDVITEKDIGYLAVRVV